MGMKKNEETQGSSSSNHFSSTINNLSPTNYSNTTNLSNTSNHSSTTKHFSHQHPLKLIQQSPNSSLPSLCAGCNCRSHCDSSLYICTTCPFYLHKRCFDVPRTLTHPSHKAHPFTLLAKPVYPSGSYGCDACGKIGNGFSYHCHPCGMDLDILCAIIPLSFAHASHVHKLDLAFESPYGEIDYTCDICAVSGNKQWLYRCKPCRFDVHLKCAFVPPAQTPLQQQQQNIISYMNSFNQAPLQQQNVPSFMNNLNQPPSTQQNSMNFMNNLNYLPTSQQQNLTSFMSNLNRPPSQQPNFTSFTNSLNYLPPQLPNFTSFTNNLNQPPSQQQNHTSFMNDINYQTPSQQQNLASLMNNLNLNPNKRSPTGAEEVGTSGPRSESENDVFDAQKRLREERIVQQAMLEALDNAGDYVGSSSSYTTTTYSYY